MYLISSSSSLPFLPSAFSLSLSRSTNSSFASLSTNSILSINSNFIYFKFELNINKFIYMFNNSLSINLSFAYLKRESSINKFM